MKDFGIQLNFRHLGLVPGIVSKERDDRGEEKVDELRRQPCRAFFSLTRISIYPNPFRILAIGAGSLAGNFQSSRMPWEKRPQERKIGDEDAELRDLIKEYSRIHGHGNVESNSESEQPARTTFSLRNPFKSLSAPSETKGELPSDEIIQGQAVSYTAVEAKLYAKEEPCDTWRHFDVISIQFRLI
jgi:hypothetical protein